MTSLHCVLFNCQCWWIFDWFCFLPPVDPYTTLLLILMNFHVDSVIHLRNFVLALLTKNASTLSRNNRFAILTIKMWLWDIFTSHMFKVLYHTKRYLIFHGSTSNLTNLCSKLWWKIVFVVSPYMVFTRKCDRAINSLRSHSRQWCHCCRYSIMVIKLCMRVEEGLFIRLCTISTNNERGLRGTGGWEQRRGLIIHKHHFMLISIDDECFCPLPKLMQPSLMFTHNQ